MKFTEIAILACYNHLKDCFRFEILEDKEYICKKICLIRTCEEEIPSQIFAQIENFILENIYPLLFDDDYFSFYTGPEFGYYDENGIFCFLSDEIFEKAVRLRKLHVFELNELLDDFATEYLLFNNLQSDN